MGRIIGLTGFAQSGKDTAAGFLVERGWTRLAFADILRQSLYNLNPIVIPGDDGDGMAVGSTHRRVQHLVDSYGWDVIKVQVPEVRELLQRMGTEVGRQLYGENFWVDMAMKRVRASLRSNEPIHDKFVITDVRFPNECDAVHNAGGLLFRIDRGNAPVNAHASEMHVATMPVDDVICNMGDLAAYEAEVLRVTGA